MVNKGYVNHASIVQFINITISVTDGSRAGGGATPLFEI